MAVLSHITHYNISKSRCCSPEYFVTPAPSCGIFWPTSHTTTYPGVGVVFLAFPILPIPLPPSGSSGFSVVPVLLWFSLILVQQVVWDISNRRKTLRRGANNCFVLRDIFTFHQALQNCSKAGMWSSCWLLWCLFYSVWDTICIKDLPQTTCGGG